MSLQNANKAQDEDGVTYCRLNYKHMYIQCVDFMQKRIFIGPEISEKF